MCSSIPSSALKWFSTLKLEMSTAALIEAFGRSVVPTYARFPLALVRGQGSNVWDAEGRKYLDFGAGIAVNTLGHGHPAIIEALTTQAATLIHTSNLYLTTQQVALAEKVIGLIGPGKCFFCNSGAEANEAIFKLARKKGHDAGRFEILTTLNSFHGRTMAGIAATGQEKVKKGFEPAVEGFRHVPYNDLEAMRRAISPKTVAILIEGIQGEGGINIATPEYLLGLRELCDQNGLLLLMDAIQCGMFRTGHFQSYQRILEKVNGKSFLPDAITMAKGLAGGLPIGMLWVRAPYADVLSAGTHGTTFGGTPLICSVALAVFDTIEKEKLGENARVQGDYLKSQLIALKSPHIKEVRGYGLMIGIELQAGIPAITLEGKTSAALFVMKLHELGLLTIPAGTHTIRLLPALNITRADCDEALGKIKQGLAAL